MTDGFDPRARLPAGWRRTAILALALSGLSCGPARSEQAYWLENGGTIVGECAGRNQGEPLKAANGSDEGIFATASLTCTDAGDAYVFRIEHLSVAINPRRRWSVQRDALDFDWLGLAVYTGRNGNQAIDWLYDEAFPIDGSLRADSSKPIYFGRIAFTVPKRVIARASRFTFYLTAHGRLFKFGLL